MSVGDLESPSLTITLFPSWSISSLLLPSCLHLSTGIFEHFRIAVHHDKQVARKPTQPQQADSPKIETVQVFIKTEEEDEKEEADAQHTHLFPEENYCLESVKSER